MLFYENHPKTSRDLWVVDLSSPDKKRYPVAVTPAEDTPLPWLSPADLRAPCLSKLSLGRRSWLWYSSNLGQRHG